MILFNLNATIYWGDTLRMEMYRERRIGKGGFMWERETPNEERTTMPEKPKPRQQELLAA